MKKYIISNYRDSFKDQFVLEVVREVEFMGEKSYIVKNNYELSPCKEIFQDDDIPLRDSLIGDSDNLYSWYEVKNKYVQLSLF